MEICLDENVLERYFFGTRILWFVFVCYEENNVVKKWKEEKNLKFNKLNFTYINPSRLYRECTKSDPKQSIWEKESYKKATTSFIECMWVKSENLRKEYNKKNVTTSNEQRRRERKIQQDTLWWRWEEGKATTLHSFYSILFLAFLFRVFRVKLRIFNFFD